MDDLKRWSILLVCCLGVGILGCAQSEKKSESKADSSDGEKVASRSIDQDPIDESSKPIEKRSEPFGEAELRLPPLAAMAAESGPEVDEAALKKMAMAAGTDPEVDDAAMKKMAMAAESAGSESPSIAKSRRSAARVGAVARPRMAEDRMAVMAPAEVETDLPPSQTTLEVFYATDRKSKYGISASDWIDVHLPALIAFCVYVLTFAGVFLTNKKGWCGFLALASLVIFLYLGQSASVNWQKQKRLADNGDANYISEIRPLSSDGLLDYGHCKVTIPPTHKIGHIDSPSLFKLEFQEDPEKHVVLHRVEQTSKDLFYDELNETIDRSRRDQALVFVHGYNVSFENAVKRTAQIAHDLKFEGAPICYSWTSHGALADYTKDMANADATVMALQSFLEETVRRTGETTIHLVAHSMGNRALLQALDRIAVSSTRSNQRLFGQLVMAAPDVSVTDFKNRYVPSAMKLASSVTLYASSKDRALLASTEIHGHNRAGLAGDNLVVIDGMDTIDVSEIDTSLIGHSYYGDHPELIRDLRALVELSQTASQRSWLTRILNPERFHYFRFTEHEIRSAEDSHSRTR